MEKKLTLKEKDKIIKKMYKNYQKAQLDLLYLNQHYNYYPQVDMFKVKDSAAVNTVDKAFLHRLEKRQYLEEYVNVINQIHSHLTKPTLSFIENEYINFYDSSWWVHMYSKSTYYREKNKAADEFLETTLYFWSWKELLNLLK